MAPQLTATEGPWRRGLAAWIARAAISFPVPDSPSMRTVESNGATCSISRLTAAIDDDDPVGHITPSNSLGHAALRSSALRATPSLCAPMHSTVCTTHLSLG